MYPIEIFRNSPCFVGLDGSDKVPDKLGQIFKLLLFFDGFLKVVLAEVS